MHPTVAKFTYNFWRGPRIVKLADTYCSKIAFAISGLPAGSGFNDEFVKAYSIQSFDRFVELHPAVELY